MDPSSPPPTEGRRAFLRQAPGRAAAAALALGVVGGGGLLSPGPARAQGVAGGGGVGAPHRVRAGASSALGASLRGSFVFARLRYDSGDWDYNPKLCANILDTILQYTHVPVHPEEVVITADSPDLQAFPFLFMTGHKLVRFSDAEREGIRRYVEGGGFLFSDDCNHDIHGLYAVSFEEEMERIFPPAEAGGDPMPRLPGDHPLYHCFFDWPGGPPQTSHELNGWGDNMVHEYLRGVEHRGRIGVLYSNKDYGCEWDFDWRNKRFRTDDNTRFAANLVTYAMT